MGMVGALMLAIAAVFILTSLFTGAPQASAGALGPMIGGIVNVLLWKRFHGRFKPALEVNAELTPEARAFMAQLMQEVYGWPYPWGSVEAHNPFSGEGSYQSPHERRRERRAWRRMYAAGSWGKRQRSARDCLNPAAFEVLDRAAAEHNRISGILETGHPELARYASSIRAAADQAMADVFQWAQIVENYPESGQAPQEKAEAEISALHELGDRLLTIQSQQPLEIDQPKPRPNAINAVLEELRLDQLAREELSKPIETEASERKLDASQ